MLWNIPIPIVHTKVGQNFRQFRQMLYIRQEYGVTRFMWESTDFGGRPTNTVGCISYQRTPYDPRHRRFRFLFRFLPALKGKGGKGLELHSSNCKTQE